MSFQRRYLRLLTSTSLLACTLASLPVAVDYQLHTPVLKVAQADSSCFAAGTLVMMADGSERPIESLAPGDAVLNRWGRASRIVAVETPRLGTRRLYGFNGRKAFVTAEHPFLTLGGWKSLSPPATARENPALTVKTLAVGDRLAVAAPAAGSQWNLALATSPELALAYLPLNRISWVEGDPEQTLYNLILEGDHSYFADGYVVHNKGGDGGEGGGSGGGEGGESDGGGSDGGEGGESDGGGSDGGEGGEGGESDGGEGGESGGDSGGESGSSGGGESGESGESGGDDGGESGESGESGDDDGGESGESGESGDDDGGESGESGESGDDDGGDRGAFGGISPAGPDLSSSEEADAIAGGWK